MLSVVIIVTLSYLAGSIPASVWIGRLFYRVDVRKYGSRNAGATNVFRVLGWKAGLLTSIVDVGKGLFAAAVIATIRVDDLPFGFEVWHVETVVRLIAGLAAVIGHMFPIWASFRGGKGVNTAAGVLFALTPLTMWIALGVFAAVLFVFRYVSLASITAAITFPTTVAIRKFVFDIDVLDSSLLVFGILMAAGIVVAHRSNIRRLLRGTENKVRSFRLARGLLNRGKLA